MSYREGATEVSRGWKEIVMGEGKLHGHDISCGVYLIM